MRDEFLHETLFFGFGDTRRRLAACVANHNKERPHSSLKYQTSATYAADLTATGGRLRNPDQLHPSLLHPRRSAYEPTGH